MRLHNTPRSLGRIAALAAVIAVGFSVQQALSAPPSAPSSVITIDPARILDTRVPVGVPTAAPVGPGATITVQVTGVGGVPASATGVIVTLTATASTSNTFVTATPTGTPRATTSVLNVATGQSIANTVTMSLGTNGRIDLYNNSGTVDLVADVSGYLLPAAAGGGPGTVVTESIELTAYSGTGTGLGAPSNLGCVDLANTGELFLDVPLPHGAAIQKVDFHWYDNDQANFTMVLFEINSNTNPTTNGTLSNSQTATTGAVGYGVSTITPTGADKVGDAIRYYIDAFTLGQVTLNGVHAFCGATVTYQMVV
jgi:hypothetical protein